tara:strand:+ start:400 stop:642 length:243 start_codon:yes stop_codon:yes gene_type:complete
MEDRKPPDPSERVQQREVDPSAYSLSTNSQLIEESFDETNEIQTWTGGNTDFSDLGDDDDQPVTKMQDRIVEDVELISED